MANKSHEALQKRVQRAMIQESFLRWESAAVISLSLILAAVAPNIIQFVPGWAWLLGGAVAEAAVVASSLTDPEFGRLVAAKVLQRDFRPQQLHDPRLQQRMNEALDYRSRIEKAIRERNDSLVKDELNETAGQIDEWLEHIYNLSYRIDRYRQEREVLERDRQRAEKRLRELDRRLEREEDPAVREQINDTLASLQRQIETLESLDSTIQRAELQLENSHTNLATIYSQTMLVDVKDIDSGRAKRLRQEIAGEVDELQDMLVAMDEVYSAQQSA